MQAAPSPFISPPRLDLEDRALGLLALDLLQGSDVDVAPQKDAQNSKSHEAGATNSHDSLYITVGMNDAVSSRAIPRKRQLSCDVAVDSRCLVLVVVWEILVHLFLHAVRPQSAGDCKTNCLADGAE